MATLKSSSPRATTIFASIFRRSWYGNGATASRPSPLASCSPGGDTRFSVARFDSCRQRFLSPFLDFAFLSFAGGVCRGLAIAIQYYHVRNVSLVKFLLQLFLRRRTRTIEIHHYKLYPALVLFVEFDRTPRLPLGIETAFTVENCVGRPAGDCRAIQMVTGDQRSILAVAGVVQLLIELEILRRMRGHSHRQRCRSCK